MKDFFYFTPTKVYFGEGKETDVGSVVRAEGASKVLVVYGGKSAIKSGLLERVYKSLKSAGVEYCSLGGVKPNPRLSLVYEGINSARENKVDMIIDGGECTFGLESTIVKIEDGKITLLRPGAITLDMLSALFDNIEVASAVTDKLEEGARPLSPGMKYRHYAPTSPLYLLSGSDERRLAYCSAADSDTLLLLFDEEAKDFPAHNVITIGKKSDEVSQAKRLFAALREADKCSCKKILAPLPKKSGISLALYNRMIRAAAHNIIEL